MSASEEEAWADVLVRWQDEGAHRAYLDGFPDLEGLAEAGRRYRAVLEARPDDPVAQRWRDEVVKRATVVALAQLPRTKPPRALSPGLRRIALAVLASAAAAAVAWIVMRWPRQGAP